MKDVYEIPTVNFDKATINLSQAKAMLNVLAGAGDDGDGFNSEKDAIQVIYAAAQMVDEASRFLNKSFAVDKKVVAPESLTSGM